MLYPTLLIAATTIFGAVSAQNTSFNPSTSDYTIDPNTVDPTTRAKWCNYEQGNCPLVCGGRGNLKSQGCDPTTLVFSCECVSNTPNISDFTNMIPSLECGIWVEQCLDAAGSDINKVTACRSVQCGDRDPGSIKQSSNPGAASSSSAAASSSSAPSKTGGSGGGATQTSSGAAASSSTGAAVALGVARNYGTGILAGSLLALFGLAL